MTPLEYEMTRVAATTFIGVFIFFAVVILGTIAITVSIFEERKRKRRKPS